MEQRVSYSVKGSGNLVPVCSLWALGCTGKFSSGSCSLHNLFSLKRINTTIFLFILPKAEVDTPFSYSKMKKVLIH